RLMEKPRTAHLANPGWRRLSANEVWEATKAGVRKRQSVDAAGLGQASSTYHPITELISDSRSLAEGSVRSDCREDRIWPAPSQVFQQSARPPQVRSNWSVMRERSMQMGKRDFPVPQNLRREPVRRLLREFGNPGVRYFSAQQLLGEAHDRQYPIQAPFVSPEADLPVEAFRHRLKQHGNVAQPERPPRCMLQQMNRQQREMIFVR